MILEKNKTIKKFTAVTLSASAVACIARTFMLSKVIEPDTGLYTSNAWWGQLFDIGVLLAIIAVALIGKKLFNRVNSVSEPDSSSTLTVFGSGLCAFMFFSVFVYGVYNMVFDSQSVGFMFKIQTVLCLPCGFNNLFVCAKEKREKNLTNALLALSVPVLLAIRIIDEFMSTDSQINTSQRSLELLMLCLMMLFFLYEAGFLVDWKDKNVSKRMYANYYTASLLAVALACVAAIPGMLASVMFMFETKSIVMSMLDCCIMLYAVSRVFTAEID